MSKGWIGCDLDGTLAHYDGWEGIDIIGKPIPAMIGRVKQAINAGYEVKIFTARASATGADLNIAINAIQDWTLKYIGVRLEVTCSKDFQMIELWDDRAVQIQHNKGVPVI